MSPSSGSTTAGLRPVAGTWTMAGPATAGFTVGNLVVKKAGGTIPVTSAFAEVAEDGTVTAAGAVLDIGRIDTGHARRDKDLRTRRLLDLDTHPTLTFSVRAVAADETGWAVTGLVTAKGKTQDVVLQATALAQSEDRVRLRLTGRLDRRDYGIAGPRFMVGALVDVDITVTLAR